MEGQTDRPMDRRTDGQTDQRTKKWLIDLRSTRLKMRKISLWKCATHPPAHHFSHHHFLGIPLCGAGDLPPTGLVGLCPNVAEVDLTNTGLDWNSVLDIFSALPRLTRGE